MTDKPASEPQANVTVTRYAGSGSVQCPICSMPMSGAPESHLPDCALRKAQEAHEAETLAAQASVREAALRETVIDAAIKWHAVNCYEHSEVEPTMQEISESSKPLLVAIEELLDAYPADVALEQARLNVKPIVERELAAEHPSAETMNMRLDAHPAPDPPARCAAARLEEVNALIERWQIGWDDEITKYLDARRSELEALLAAPRTEQVK